MKSRDGKSQRREEKKEEDQKRESLRRKKIQVREKVGKSRHTVFFQCFVAPEGQKVGSLKRRVRSPLGRWEMSKAQKTVGYGALLDVQMCFCVAGARDCAPCQNWAKREGFVAFPKRWQAWDIWRGSAKMDFAWQAQYKRHIDQRC